MRFSTVDVLAEFGWIVQILRIDIWHFLRREWNREHTLEMLGCWFAVPSSTTIPFMFRTVRLQFDLANIAITGVPSEIDALPLELQCLDMKEDDCNCPTEVLKLLGQNKGVVWRFSRSSF